MKSLIFNFAVRVATDIKKNLPNESVSVDVIRYGLEILINIVSIIGFTILISLLTGNVIQAIISIISFVLVKQITGGIHLKTNEACIIFSVLTFTFISFLELSQMINFILNIISLILIVAFAPTSHTDKRLLLKSLGCLTVLICLIFSNTSLTVTIFIQALTLVRLKGGDKFE